MSRASAERGKLFCACTNKSLSLEADIVRTHANERRMSRVRPCAAEASAPKHSGTGAGEDGTETVRKKLAALQRAARRKLADSGQHPAEWYRQPEKETEGFRLICDINADHHGTALDVFCEDGPSGPVNLVATQLRMEDGRLVIGFIGKYPITAGDFPFEERARKAAGARNFELKVTKLTAPNYFEPDRQVVKRLTEVSNRVLDRQDVPFVMSGGTYARKLPNALAFGTGMELPPAPEGLFRPGHGDYHQPDESIRLLRIEKALEVYICSLLEIDSLGSLLA